jgi:hypothetical protein
MQPAISIEQAILAAERTRQARSRSGSLPPTSDDIGPSGHRDDASLKDLTEFVEAWRNRHILAEP